MELVVREEESLCSEGFVKESAYQNECRRGVAVTSLGVSTKLLYVRPG